MDKNFQNTFEYNLIYVFTIDDEAHKGFLKIGDATLHSESLIDSLPPNCRELNQAALARIKEYTNTAGVTPHLLHTELAVRTIPNKQGNWRLEAFRDYQVQNVLKNSGIKNVMLGNTTGKEWFPVGVETAIKAIEAVKKGFANLSNSDVTQTMPIIFRPEQDACINKVVKHFKKEKADRFLINAKMRFGKTCVALEIIKRCQFHRTIILTHRPVVDDGWYEDFTKIFGGQENFVYGSKSKGYTAEELLSLKKDFIYFASIQDLRGSAAVNGKFAKNDAVFNTVWDCVIVDEAHEGTTTALGEDTVKAVWKKEKGTKLIALSGTPFNIITDYDEDSIYTWDYVMEQECKAEWNKNHFGDSNPYDELPELRIYTYSLGDILHNENYITYEDKAFNFHEFFRVYTGDYDVDYENIPEGKTVGDFVHEGDIWSFLNLLVKEDSKSQYPYATEAYRELFKHSLWMVPGVREARALKKLMMKHPVFGSGAFDVVNVAGVGDEEEKSEEALTKVKNAIQEAKKNNTYTITLSCGKLTTGVTVREWTAVFMLSGSYSVSAANYLQTIFRVQSPCNDNGKIKSKAYVFDFAPDRTLKMVTSAVQVSSKAGKTQMGDRAILGKFLNYCPVIAISGSSMEEYHTDKLLQELKKAYADKVVRNGFDDVKLYNDGLLNLTEVDWKKFKDLKGIIGTSKASPNSNEISINDQGLTDENREELDKPGRRPRKKKSLTPEEKAKLEELKKKKKERMDAISILRAISIRMPLLIYGADVPYTEEINLSKFVDLVDDSSWKEFMPDGVTKAKFKHFIKYYDEDIFIAAGRRIRNVAREADTLEPLERVKKIAALFSQFKNPDKETVLTPWKVVNRHMSDCLGGWCFYDESFREDKKLEVPRYVKRGQATGDVFDKEDTKILEINSKTGLYPLYMTYSVYREKIQKRENPKMTLEEKQDLWKQVVQNHIFVICKTPMAKAITKRTLIGYRDWEINAHYLNNLVNTLQNKSGLFVKKVQKATYWKKGNGTMKWDAIVGNPPYQQMDGGNKSSAKPIYHLFVDSAIAIGPQYISMITPSRWFNGGKGLDAFREKTLADHHLVMLKDFQNAKDCFPSTSIGGGVNYFLWAKRYDDKCKVINVINGAEDADDRYLNEFENYIRYNKAVSIVRKVLAKRKENVVEYITSRNPFGLPTNARGSSEKENGDLTLYSSAGVSFIHESDITQGNDLVDVYKIMISRLSAEHAGEPDKSGQYRILSKMKILMPSEVCTDSYIIAFANKNRNYVENAFSFLQTKFVRFLILQTLSSINMSRNGYSFVPMHDFNELWDDERLNAYYGISEDEVAYIDKTVKAWNK